MKYIRQHILTIILLATFGALTAQKQTTKLNETINLRNANDSLQYSLGAFVGKWMLSNGFSITNPMLFNAGLNAGVKNSPKAISDSSITPLIASYQLSTQNEKSRLQEAELFSSLKGKPGVGALPNGVHYIVIKQNSGIRPIASDTITFEAIGLFPDGTVFEDSFKKNQSITNITRNLIPGLSEAVQLMPEGSVWRIFIPSALAYGPAGLTNVIPPNTALVYEITLNKVKR